MSFNGGFMITCSEMEIIIFPSFDIVHTVKHKRIILLITKHKWTISTVKYNLEPSHSLTQENEINHGGLRS